MIFLLAAGGVWLVLPGKQEPDPEDLPLHLHLIFYPFCLLLPALERKCCHCRDKENGFPCVTVPIPGYHYILRYLLCSEASFLILLLASAGGSFRGYTGWATQKPLLGYAKASAELVAELTPCVGSSCLGALGKPRKHKLRKTKLKDINVEGLVNIICLKK